MRRFNGSELHTAAHGWPEGRPKLVSTRFCAAVSSVGRQPRLGPVIWCLGSGTWLKNSAPIPVGVLIVVQLYGKLEQMHAQTASVRHGSAFQAVAFGDFAALVEHLCVV